MKVQIAQELMPNFSPIEQVLEKRKLDMDWIEADERFFHDGRDLFNYEKGKDFIGDIFLKESPKVAIQVDNDADGFTSASAVYLWLKKHRPDLNLQFIITDGKVHGVLEHLVPDDLDFLIIPDASSSEGKKHKRLAQKGIRILVLDHHEITDYDTPAIVINPHHKECKYPNKNLSGAGVVYKFIEGFDNDINTDNHSFLMDLVAISTVADVMSLKNYENKALVNKGLKNIQNPLFKSFLLNDFRMRDKNVNPIAVAFYFAPLINAMTRLASAEEKLEVMEAFVGEISPEPTIALMTKIKGKQDRNKESVLPRIVMKLQRGQLDKNKIILTDAPKTLHKAATGLIAGNLASAYQKPTLLGRDKDDDFVGSIRSINDSNVENFKDFCEESGLFNWVAGC